MRGELAFEKFGEIDLGFVLEAAPRRGTSPAGAPVAPALHKEPFFSRYGGLVAALVCGILAVGIYVGILINRPDSTPIPPVGTGEGDQAQTQAVTDASTEEHIPENTHEATDTEATAVTETTEATDTEATAVTETTEATDAIVYTLSLPDRDIVLVYSHTQEDTENQGIVDVYTDKNNVEYLFFEGTHVLKRFEDLSYQEGDPALIATTDASALMRHVNAIIRSHAFLFWDDYGSEHLTLMDDGSFVYRDSRSLSGSHFDEESVYMAFNKHGALYAYAYTDTGLFSQCVKAVTVEDFENAKANLPTYQKQNPLIINDENVLCYYYEVIVDIPTNERETDEYGNVLEFHEHYFKYLPILVLTPPERPPLTSNDMVGFDYYHYYGSNSNTLTFNKETEFSLECGIIWNASASLHLYDRSDLIPQAVLVHHTDEITLSPSNSHGFTQTSNDQNKSIYTSVYFVVPATAPDGSYDLILSFNGIQERYENVITVKE